MAADSRARRFPQAGDGRCCLAADNDNYRQTWGHPKSRRRVSRNIARRYGLAIELKRPPLGEAVLVPANLFPDARGRSLVARPQASILMTRVRFPPPAFSYC